MDLLKKLEYTLCPGCGFSVVDCVCGYTTVDPLLPPGLEDSLLAGECTDTLAVSASYAEWQTDRYSWKKREAEPPRKTYYNMTKLRRLSLEQLSSLEADLVEGSTWQPKVRHYWVIGPRTLCDRELKLAHPGTGAAERLCGLCNERRRFIIYLIGRRILPDLKGG